MKIMRIYRLTVLAISALAAMTFSSCSNEVDVVNAESPFEEVNTSPTIVFNLIAPSGSALHYTRAVGDNIDDVDAEATIEDLRMYEFDAATGALIEKVDLTSILNSPATGSSAKDYTYSYAPTGNLTNNNARQYLFVANYSSLFAAVNTEAEVAADAALTTPVGLTLTTLSDVRDMITTALSGTSLNQKSVWTTETNEVIPMTAFAMLNNSDVIPMEELNSTGDNVVTTTVNLTRIVARIDVVNNTPGLVINELILVKANNESYLLPKTNNSTGVVSIPSSDTYYGKVSMTFDDSKVISPATQAAPYLDTYNTSYLGTFEIPLDANHVNLTNLADIAYTGSVVEKNVKLEQAFYVYEDIARDNVSGDAPAEALHLQVRGTLNEIAVSYNIPFTKDLVEGAASGTAKDGFAIKRNNLYTVVLGDGKKSPVHTEVQAQIRVLNWDQEVVTDYFDASVFKIYDGATTNTGVASAATGDAEAEMTISTKTINVAQDNSTTSGDPIEFVIASPYSEVSDVVATVQSVDGQTLTQAWVTVTALDGTPANNKGYKVTVSPNTGTSPTVRSASIKIEYKVTPSGGSATAQTPITYTLIQANS